MPEWRRTQAPVKAVIPVVINCASAHRRGGRVAEGGGLLNRYTVKSCIGGSNPPLSATQPGSQRNPATYL